MAGCAGTQAQPEKKPEVHPVAAQAQFDLNCPRSKLGYMRIADDQWGAVGCGKRARYRNVCGQRLEREGSLSGRYDVKDECRWQLDSPVMVQDAPSEAPAVETPSSGI